jgi:hypothetical protein
LQEKAAATQPRTEESIDTSVDAVAAAPTEQPKEVPLDQLKAVLGHDTQKQ